MTQDVILKELLKVNGPLSMKELATALDIDAIYVASNVGALLSLEKVRRVIGTDTNRYEIAAPQ